MFLSENCAFGRLVNGKEGRQQEEKGAQQKSEKCDMGTAWYIGSKRMYLSRSLSKNWFSMARIIYIGRVVWNGIMGW